MDTNTIVDRLSKKETEKATTTVESTIGCRRIDGQTVDSAPPFVDVATNSNSSIIEEGNREGDNESRVDDRLSRNENL
jgi:hypothetical protein